MGGGAPDPDVRRRSAVGIVAAVVSLVFWGMTSVIGRVTDLDPLSLVFYRLWLAALFATVVLYARGGRVDLGHLKLSVAGGIGFAFDLMLFFTAIRRTTVANATVIVAMVPLPMLVVAPRLFGERLARSDVAWAAVAMGGVGLLVFGSTGLPTWSPAGDVLAVGALLAWTLYVAASKRTRDRVDALSYTTHTGIVAALVVTPFALLSGQDLSWPDGDDWFWVAVSAIVVGWGGHLLMNVAIGRIPVWLSGTLQLGIPVSATVLVALFLDEPVTLLQVAGMGLAITAMAAMAVQSQRRTAPPT